ncbi:MAG: methylenetetrahydrofolate--tRNA-(uracil(54)-C(5))-methyltransferase (FADH(2)-oxidizing) TrmFO [Candidatus Desulfofervidaceae bacterium]|nr:methylenetetrahydrofolate--tRNA-(uracil(54)-C(5))-methyltransferase (FADH(2)-oxidizing) TrmFO [Candidatus Desulfofervidaceae bacterium]
MDMKITIIGGGLAGVEAAWQVVKQGGKVILYEMRPKKFTPAHKTPYLAELVCSNSLRSQAVNAAVGLLKKEMQCLGSLVMEAALATAVPAGKALAVDRTLFAQYITKKISRHPRIEIRHEEVKHIPRSGIVIIATGPLTGNSLSEDLRRLTGKDYLHFYDAIAPIVYAESINMEIAFRASRYGKGEDYINCPMDEKEYDRFYEALLKAERVPLHTFEKPHFFEGCLPIEVMAERGKDTLRFGPMKPVGLTDPRTGKQPYAVVQLRQDNQEGTLYNMVGFQTKLKWTEQKRVFRLIPGLEQAEFARYGSIHRNTFIDAPHLLDHYLRLKPAPHIFIAGQLSGVEGYVESAATGILAGINAWRLGQNKLLISPPPTTALGALISHLTNIVTKNFQPMNINWGLFPSLGRRVPKKERGKLYATRALADLERWLKDCYE